MALVNTITSGGFHRPVREDVGSLYFPSLRTSVACCMGADFILSIDLADLTPRTLRVSKSIAYPETAFWTEISAYPAQGMGGWSPSCIWEVAAKPTNTMPDGTVPAPIEAAVAFPPSDVPRIHTNEEGVESTSYGFWSLSIANMVGGSGQWSQLWLQCEDDTMSSLLALPPTQWVPIGPHADPTHCRFMVTSNGDGDVTAGVYIVKLTFTTMSIALEGLVPEPKRPDTPQSAADERRLEAAISCWGAMIRIQGYACQVVPPARKGPTRLPQYEHNVLISSHPPPAVSSTALSTKRILPPVRANPLSFVVAGGWCTTTDSPNDGVYVLSSDRGVVACHDGGGMPDVPVVDVFGPQLGLKLPENEGMLEMSYTIEAKSFRYGFAPELLEEAKSPALSISSSEGGTEEVGANPFDLSEFLSNTSAHPHAAKSPGHAKPKVRSHSYASATKASAGRHGAAPSSPIRNGSIKPTTTQSAVDTTPSSTILLSAVEVCRCPPNSFSGFASYLYKYDPCKEALLWIGSDGTYALKLNKAHCVWETLKVGGKPATAALPAAVTKEVDAPLAVMNSDGKLHIVVHSYQDTVEAEGPRNAPNLYQTTISRLYVLMSGDAPAKRKDIAIWRAPLRTQSPPCRRKAAVLPSLADSKGNSCLREPTSPRKRVEDIATKSLLHSKSTSSSNIGRILKALALDPTTLDISQLTSPIPCEDIYTITLLGHQYPHLRSLNLSHQEFGSVETRLLMKSLIVSCPHITSISCRGTHFSPADRNAEVHSQLEDLCRERGKKQEQDTSYEEIRNRERKTRRVRRKAIIAARVRIEQADQRSILEMKVAQTVTSLYWTEASAMVVLFAEFQLTTFFLRAFAQKAFVEQVGRLELDVIDVASTLREEERRSWRRLNSLHEGKIVELIYRQQRQEEARQRHQLEVERRQLKRQEQKYREIARSYMQTFEVDEKPDRAQLEDARDAQLADMQVMYRVYMRMYHICNTIQRAFNDSSIVLEHHYKQACDAATRNWKTAQKAAVVTFEQEILNLARGREREVEDTRLAKAAFLESSRRDVVRWLRSERLKSRLDLRAVPPKVFLEQPAKELILTEESMYSQPLPIASGLSVSPVVPYYMKNRAVVEMEEDEVRTETWIHLKSAIHRMRITATIQRKGANGRTYSGSSVAVAAFSGDVPIDTLNAITQAQLEYEDEWAFYERAREDDDTRARPPPSFNPPQSIPRFVPASTRLQMQGHPFTEEGAVIVDSVSKRELGTYVITPLEEHVVTLHTECTEENIRAVLQCFSLVAGSDPDDGKESVTGALFRERLFVVSYRVDGLFAVPPEATDFTTLSTPKGAVASRTAPKEAQDWTSVPREQSRSSAAPVEYIVATVTHDVTLHVIPLIVELPNKTVHNYVEQSGPQPYCRGVTFTASCNNFVIPFLPKGIVTVQMAPQIDPFDAFQFGSGLTVEDRPVWQPEGATPSLPPISNPTSMRSLKAVRPTMTTLAAHPCLPSKLVVTYQGEVLATILEPGPLRMDNSMSQLAAMRSRSMLKQSSILQPRPPSQDKPPLSSKSPKTKKGKPAPKSKEEEQQAEQLEQERIEQHERQQKRRQLLHHQILMQTSQNPTSSPIMILQLSEGATGEHLLQLLKGLYFVNDSCMPVEEQRRIVVGLSLLTPVSLTSGELLSWAPGTGGAGNAGTGAVAASIASGAADGKIKGLEVHSFASCCLQVEAKDDPAVVDLCLETMGFRLLHPVHASHLEYCSGARSTDIYFASSAIVWDTDTKEFSGGYLNIAIVEGFKKDRDVLDFKPQGQRAYTADFSMSVGEPFQSGADEDSSLLLGKRLSLEGHEVLYDGELVAILDRHGGHHRSDGSRKKGGTNREEGPFMVGSTIPLHNIPTGGKLTFNFVQRCDEATGEDSGDPAVPKGYRPLACSMEIAQEIVRCITFATKSTTSNIFNAVTEHRTIVCEFAHGDTKPVYARCNVKVTAPLVSLPPKDSFMTHRENSGPCLICKDFSVAKDDDGWDNGFILLECVRGFNPETDSLSLAAGYDLELVDVTKTVVRAGSMKRGSGLLSFKPARPEAPSDPKMEGRFRAKVRQIQLQRAVSLTALHTRMLGLAKKGSPKREENPSRARDFEVRYVGSDNVIATLSISGTQLKVTFPPAGGGSSVRAKDVSLLLRRLTYESTDNNPQDLTRIFKVTANDGRPHSTCATVQVEILTIDDATEITRPGADPDVPVHFRALSDDDLLGFALLPDVVVDDPDTFQFNDAVLSVECVGGSERTDCLYILSEEQQVAHERNRRFAFRMAQYREWLLERQQRDLLEAANRTAAALEVSMIRQGSMKRSMRKIPSHRGGDDSSSSSPARVAETDLPMPRLDDEENDVDYNEFASNVVTTQDFETETGVVQAVFLGGRPLGTIRFKKGVPTLTLRLGPAPSDDTPTTHEQASASFNDWDTRNTVTAPSSFPFVPIVAVQRFFRTVGFKSMHSNLHKLRGGHRVFEVKVAVGKVVGKLRHTLNAQPPIIAQLSAPSAPQISYTEGSDPARLFPDLHLVTADLGTQVREGSVTVGILEDPDASCHSSDTLTTALSLRRMCSFSAGRDASGEFVNPSLFVETADTIVFLNDQQYAPFNKVTSSRRDSVTDLSRSKKIPDRRKAAPQKVQSSSLDPSAFSIVDGNQLYHKRDYIGTFVSNKAAYYSPLPTQPMRKVSTVVRAQLTGMQDLSKDEDDDRDFETEEETVAPAQPDCVSSVSLKLDGASKATLAHIEAFIRRVGYQSTSSNPSTHLRTGFVEISLGPGWEGKGAVPLQVIADDDPTEIEPLTTSVQCVVDGGALGVLAGVRVSDPDTHVFTAPSYVRLEMSETGSKDAMLRGVASGKAGSHTATLFADPLHAGEWLYLSCLPGDAQMIAPEFAENCDGPFESKCREVDAFEEARMVAESESGLAIYSDMLEGLFEKGSQGSFPDPSSRRLVCRLVRFGPVHLALKLLNCRIDELQLLVGLVTYNTFTPPSTPKQPISNMVCPVANTSRTLSISVRSGTAPTFRTAVTVQVLASLLTPYPLRVSRVMQSVRQKRGSIISIETPNSPICAADVDLPWCSGRPVPALTSLCVGRGLIQHGCLFTVSLSPPPPFPKGHTDSRYNSRCVCRSAATLAAKATSDNGRRTLLLRPCDGVELKALGGGKLSVAGGDDWTLSRAPKECTLIVNREIAGHLSVLNHSCIAGTIYPLGHTDSTHDEGDQTLVASDVGDGGGDVGEVLEKVLRRVFFVSDELSSSEVISCVYVTVVSLGDGLYGTYSFGVRESLVAEEEL